MHSSEQLRRHEWDDEFPPWVSVTNRTSEYRWDRGWKWRLRNQLSWRRGHQRTQLVAALALWTIVLAIEALRGPHTGPHWAIGAAVTFTVLVASPLRLCDVGPVCGRPPDRSAVRQETEPLIEHRRRPKRRISSFRREAVHALSASSRSSE